MISKYFKIKYQLQNQEQLNESFLYACYKGLNENIEYLLTSPELKTHANIDYYDDSNQYGFNSSIFNNQLETLKILIELYPKLSINPDFFYKHSLLEAAHSNRKEIFKYLLNVPEIRYQLDIEDTLNSCFTIVCDMQRFEIAQYLIFEYGLNKTPDINHILLSYSRNKTIEKMFEQQEFKYHLDEKLSIFKTEKNKLKI